jgi:hypothetical protein
MVAHHLVVTGSAASRTGRGPSRSSRAERCSRRRSVLSGMVRPSGPRARSGVLLAEASMPRESTPRSRGEPWMGARVFEPVAVVSNHRGPVRHRLWMHEGLRFGLCAAARMLISRVLGPVSSCTGPLATAARSPNDALRGDFGRGAGFSRGVLGFHVGCRSQSVASGSMPSNQAVGWNRA